MNLPAPFKLVEDPIPLYQHLSEVLGHKRTEVAAKSIRVEDDSENGMDDNHDASGQEPSENESELESEGEGEKSVKTPPVPIKRRLRPPNTIRKKPKLSLLKQTCMPHPRAPEFSVSDVFEATEAQGSRRLELRLKDTILPLKDDSTRVESTKESGSFGKIESLSTQTKNNSSSESMLEWQRESDKYIKREEILSNRVDKSGNDTIIPLFILCFTAALNTVGIHICSSYKERR